MADILPPKLFFRGLTTPLLAPIPDGAKTLWFLIASHCWDGKPFVADSSTDADRYFAGLMQTGKRTKTTDRTIRSYRTALVSEGLMQERVHESSRKVEFIPVGLLDLEADQPLLSEPTADEVGKNFPNSPKRQEEFSSSTNYSSFNTNNTRTQNLRSKLGKNFPNIRKKFSNSPMYRGKNFPTSSPPRPEFGKKLPTSPDPAPIVDNTIKHVDKAVDNSGLTPIEQEMATRLDAIGIFGRNARTAIQKAVGSNLTPDELVAYAQTVIAKCQNAENPGGAAGWQLANRPLKRVSDRELKEIERSNDTKRRFRDELE